ncbi:MAG: RHS repeat-associated core domain-containing protein [Aquisalimonadaceae bacterium]
MTGVQLPGQGTYTVDEYRWTAPAQLTLPGGGRRNLDYDGYLRPSRIQGLDPATNPVQEDAYHYSAVDNILNRATLRGEYGYDYDAADRLTGEDGPERAIHYAYDPVGNRLSETDSTATGAPPHTWEYDANDRLLQRGPIHYSYDASGNLTLQHHAETGAETRYRYDVDNRLIEVRNQHDALVARYAYDPFGRRIRKTVGDVTTHYLYAEEGLVAELDAAGTVITSYGYAPDSVWGTNPLFIKQGNQFGYYHNDHLGTPQAITAANGALLWSATYGAFGQARVTTESTKNNLRFPGQYFDSETGLHYNWHRYYNPGTGRYITSDPIELRGGLNTYSYVDNNPLRWIDPEGLAKMCCRLLNSVAGSIGRQRHCYIVADEGTVYGLYPSDGKGVPGINDPRDTGGECFDCPALQCDDQNECLRNAHNNYPVGGYSSLGPNSNTYAGTLASKCCKGGIPSGVSNAPGVNDNPPSLPTPAGRNRRGRR